ncbi:calmodulin-binding transcription activator 5 isoform X1 [Tripterygium wilfordii]|uniref:Calmodulin-binding transcription activator 5 isoform X1 n=2 Tax=Tripterygium wilfordii TaxID=458696 RepID=A0A7J7CSJ5_TRIWF|nr:calmodulin-binding transcription activator 5-like isoform X1 [Tripterygium wilfordii]KAF5737041.1 calmodulin-binding transcription activator 5 isoform X1 [Tripterygium wilfordii]
MESAGLGQLTGSEIHGFHTTKDLDFGNIMKEAGMRWLRPNEIHAILCNYKYFSINVKPVNLPKSGTIVLFDRRMLRNFRKDGHNWKKKTDGKTVKEAHERLKVGNEERIHVYYARGKDNPNFARRCYWLLDKSLEHIVLVHYRDQELLGSPVTPANSNSTSASDNSTPSLLLEFDSGDGHAFKQLEPRDSLTVRSHEMRLHELNTLEWDELVANDANNHTTSNGGKVPYSGMQNQTTFCASMNDGSRVPAYNLLTEISLPGNLAQPVASSERNQFNVPDSINSQTIWGQVNSNAQRRNSGAVEACDSMDNLVNDGLQSQGSFCRWMNDIISDSPGSVEDPVLESSFSSGHDSFSLPMMDQHHYSETEQIFTITDISPAWAYSTENTKILVAGVFQEQYLHLVKSKLFCVCDGVSIHAEIVQIGVYCCFLPPHSPNLVDLYMSLDGQKPISQNVNFDYRAPSLPDPIVSSGEKTELEEFQVQMRLSYFLFSTSKSLNILNNKVSPNALKEAKKFSSKTSSIANSWAYMIKSIEDNKVSHLQAKDVLLEVTVKNKLKEWLLERVVEGSRMTEYDALGQGVIHLCAILGYTWAVYLFSLSGLSLDFRDKLGWTALHWAAYYGREKMVAILLSAGAKPNLVTDPTPDNPGGCTAADLASIKGHDGLAAYLSEKALVEHFKDMSVAGNASGTLQISASDVVNSENLTEDELYLKDTLAAYRTAADAAARIQGAFREHSFKVRTKAVKVSNPEDEARNIIAAMKIQNAFRNFESRKKMTAALHIQHSFRTWKIRKEFLNMRRKAVRIQAAFRGFQVRRQYRKIIWSVGVLEKVILRWRLKRKGFRGFQIDPIETNVDQSHVIDPEEDFYRASRKQAEDRVERSVVFVQAMFRSRKAQQEYRRMKLAHSEAELEYEGLLNGDTGMYG